MPAFRNAASLLLALGLCACSSPRTPERTLAVASDDEAAALIERFLQAYEGVHVETAVALLCERDAQSLEAAREFIRRSQAPGSPFRVARHEVRRVEPKWRGDEPFFFVEVAFPRAAGGEVRHGYHVRVRDGCIEGLLPPDGPGGHAAPERAPAADDAPPEAPAPAPASAEPGEIEL